MSKHNPNNERIKRQYFTYLNDAYGYSEATVDAVAKALDRFEEDTKRKDFKAYHYEQAIAFKRHLVEQRNQETGKPGGGDEARDLGGLNEDGSAENDADHHGGGVGQAHGAAQVARRGRRLGPAGSGWRIVRQGRQRISNAD